MSGKRDTELIQSDVYTAPDIEDQVSRRRPPPGILEPSQSRDGAGVPLPRSTTRKTAGCASGDWPKPMAPATTITATDVRRFQVIQAKKRLGPGK